MVLPLALVPFESYMLADDRPAYPMNFFFRLGFAGVLREDRFNDAWRAAVARHPLLGAVVERRRGGLFWTLTDQSPVVQWASSATPEPAGPSTNSTPGRTEGRANAASQISGLDLFREPGVRARIHVVGGRTDLLLQFHHASSDGLGAVRFVEDLLVAYAVPSSEERNRHWATLSPDALRRRGEFGLTSWKLIKMAPQQAVGLLGARQFLFRQPLPLGAGLSVDPSNVPPAEYPACVTRGLSFADTKRMEPRAQVLEVTTNDWLLSHLFRVVGEWRSKQGDCRPQDWLRMSVPMNLRTAADKQMPAANVVSMVFLDRRFTQLGDSSRLLATVHEEMGLIKRLRLGLTFVLSLRAARPLGAISLFCKTDQCRATMVLTNLGRVWRCRPLLDAEGRVRLDDATLDQVEIAAPLRPGTSLAVATFAYAGRRWFTWHFDPRVLSAEHVRCMADDYLNRLSQDLG